ncbi:hypothetical protein Pmani_000591 [Petrolisthes manimaculis]|uniref:Uncharacterized protein n=1 Tax=Petrolisthes manimaculis TaxID=1843537 RepID=A0AAE1QM77_9EUCA|nr:hypothetical protein Pmani_000591 [Petrolisthes manimaculis]
MEHIRQLQAKSAAMEEREKKLQAEIEEMWRLVNMALSNQMQNLNMSPAPVTSQQLEEKKKEDIQKKIEERKSRIDGDIRPNRPKGSPKPSPTRGGSHLRHSYSAFNLSQVSE